MDSVVIRSRDSRPSDYRVQCEAKYSFSLISEFEIVWLGLHEGCIAILVALPLTPEPEPEPTV